MSIITKVIILFFISFSLMIFVSNETNKLTQNTIETLLKDKYIQVSDELFTYLSNNDMNNLKNKLKELDFKEVLDKEHYLKTSSILYQYKTELSSIEILQHEDNRYLLYMTYLDDDLLVMDQSQGKIFKDKEFLNYMILVDILILIILSFVILKMIYPLKELSGSIKKFGEGDYSMRSKKVGSDEIGELSDTFNAMAMNIENLITSRQRLLRDIGHELKTPISKSKLAVEMVEESKYKKILKKALDEIDQMTSELLDIEKLNSNQQRLIFKSFDMETLVGLALSKLFVEDESKIDVDIESNFSVNADLNYLSIALKNLIDNALKYGTEKPVHIIVKEKSIVVKSKGKQLDKPLEFYCEDFTQGDNSRNQKGYGLGLSLVKRILDKHKFQLLYYYEKGFNFFAIETGV
ncbi:ArsS family sensor histidine kinase [Sulfurimonas sp. C5]|uniref:ArsS family sensor histidine kinase n=1 Tax=Sulfurimonas sp. C5 TaxID=3036947 RepID=UPI0024569745|nr:ArsS family sensor histidine kinase [Sulfurimonas sp. C5]MDH4944047.1 ArsS family sensor histidine kinase [Sulfurimonas sp. C5]